MQRETRLCTLLPPESQRGTSAVAREHIHSRVESGSLMAVDVPMSATLFKTNCTNEFSRIRPTSNWEPVSQKFDVVCPRKTLRFISVINPLTFLSDPLTKENEHVARVHFEQLLLYV